MFQDTHQYQSQKKCCVSNCLNLKNYRRCHVNRRQNKRTKQNSGFYSHVHQTILLGDFLLDYIVELKQNYLLSFLKVYPIYRQINYLLYLSTSLNVFSYSHITQYVKRSHARASQFQVGYVAGVPVSCLVGSTAAHRNTHGWRLSLAQQTLVSNMGARKKKKSELLSSQICICYRY